MFESRLNRVDAAGIINSGGVIILSTDTLPGLHCRADYSGAVQRITQIKGRPVDKSLLVLASDLKQAGQIMGALNGRQLDYCNRCWPGPFSLILPAAGTLSNEVTAGTGTVAVRVPDLGGMVALLKAVGHPLVSTSVNLAGQAPATTLDQAEAVFAGQIDGSHDCRTTGRDVDPVNVSSALVDLTVWPPKLLRDGPLVPPDMEPGGS